MSKDMNIMVSYELPNLIADSYDSCMSIVEKYKSAISGNNVTSVSSCWRGITSTVNFNSFSIEFESGEIREQLEVLEDVRVIHGKGCDRNTHFGIFIRFDRNTRDDGSKIDTCSVRVYYSMSSKQRSYIKKTLSQLFKGVTIGIEKAA